METPTPMSREELRELAALDALGLLDEYEAALFTRSFHHAPVAVQDEIKMLQSQVVTDPLLLPDVEPPAELRASVLEAVATAIEDESGQLAPLATIGRPQPSMPASSPSRSAWSTSSHFWRAAAFVFAAVSLVLTYFTVQAQMEANQLLSVVLGTQLEPRFESKLPEYTRAIGDLKNPRGMLIGGPDARRGENATVVLDRPGRDIIFRLESLDLHETYTITATDQNNVVRLTSEFEAISTIWQHVIHNVNDETMEAFNALSWSVADSSGNVVLRSA